MMAQKKVQIQGTQIVKNEAQRRNWIFYKAINPMPVIFTRHPGVERTIIK